MERKKNQESRRRRTPLFTRKVIVNLNDVVITTWAVVYSREQMGRFLIL